jgi:hypothetical protein
MKCFRILSDEYLLPISLFKRIGAFNVSEPYNSYTYVSTATLAAFRKSLKEHFKGKLIDKSKVATEVRKHLNLYSPKICTGLPTGLILVDVQSVLSARMDEQMVSELARERGLS